VKPAKIIQTSLLLATSYLLLATYPVQAEVSTGLSAIPPRLPLEVKADAAYTETIKVRNE